MLLKCTDRTMSVRCLNQHLTWPEGESEDTVAEDNTLDAVKGPEVATKYTYKFDIKDKNIITRNKLENEIYRLRGKEMGEGRGTHVQWLNKYTLQTMQQCHITITIHHQVIFTLWLTIVFLPFLFCCLQCKTYEMSAVGPQLSSYCLRPRVTILWASSFQFTYIFHVYTETMLTSLHVVGLAAVCYMASYIFFRVHNLHFLDFRFLKLTSIWGGQCRNVKSGFYCVRQIWIMFLPV